MESREIRRAIVFPGQGSGGGECSGEVEEAVRAYVGDARTPYQLSVFASSVDLLYRFAAQVRPKPKPTVMTYLPGSSFS